MLVYCLSMLLPLVVSVQTVVFVCSTNVMQCIKLGNTPLLRKVKSEMWCSHDVESKLWQSKILRLEVTFEGV